MFISSSFSKETTDFQIVGWRWAKCYEAAFVEIVCDEFRFRITEFIGREKEAETRLRAYQPDMSSALKFYTLFEGVQKLIGKERLLNLPIPMLRSPCVTPFSTS
jgi:hypothetical protein